jgi:hypothetical protein
MTGSRESSQPHGVDRDPYSLISRALASEYPYDLKYRKLPKHPSVRSKVTEMGASFRYPPGEDLDSEAVIMVISRDARRRLKSRKVVHFEVIIRDAGFGWYAVVERPERGTDVE